MKKFIALFLLTFPILLHAGAATSELQTAGNAGITSIDSKTPALVGGKVPVDATVSSTVLPTGASTAALQTTGNSTLSSILAKIIAAPATEAKQDTGNTKLTSIDSKLPILVGGKVPVDATIGSIALPTGASTAALQTAGNNSLAALVAALTNPLPVSGTFWQATQPVSVASLPLPSGGATSAAQTTGNASLASIDSKLTAPIPVTTGGLTDAQLRASAVPVSIDSMPSTPVTGTFWQATQPVSIAGTITTTGGLTDAQLRAAPVIVDGSAATQPVSAVSLPLPTLAATSTKQSDGTQKTQLVDADGTSATVKQAGVLPTPADTAQVVAVQPQNIFRSTFAAVQSGVDSSFFSLIQTGTNQTVNQSAGNLVVVSGTTANAETIIRSNVAFKGSMLARIQTILSQRIANNNFYVELVDVIGDGLAVTVNSATSITVTIPGNPFTSANVGQGMYVGAVQNISASAVPMRAVIASVSGNNVTFTVAGWPASGSGTCSLFGWDNYKLLYTSTTATQAAYGSQRRGWNSGDTTATINTTASAGHMAILANSDGNAYLADQLVASVAGTVQTTQRASRVLNLPEENTPLYLQLRVVNGTSAPASTTTWTVGTVSVENYNPQAVVINNVKAQGNAAQLPVAVTNSPAVTVSSGTVTAVTTVTTLANGQTANSTAATGSPLRVGGIVKTTHDTTMASGDAANLATTTSNAAIAYPNAPPELSWQYAAGAAGIVNTTTAVTMKAAAAASIRNYVASCQVSHAALSAATELVIRDGAAGTVIWRATLGTAAVENTNFTFAQPIRGTAATLLEVATLTAVTGGVYVNCQGFEAL